MKRGRIAATAGLPPGQAQTLALLYRNRNKLNTPFAKGEPEPGWCRPIDIGGAQKTSHCTHLSRLYGKGLVERRPYDSPHRKDGGSWAKIYRITPLGVSGYELYVEHLAQLPAPPSP